MSQTNVTTGMVKSDSEVQVNLAALISGLIFGVGLVIAGMTQPGKVIGFLDLAGNWDPSLIFVMGGAMGLHLITYRLVRKRPTPVLVKEWQVPTKTEITKALVIGAFLFGVGWGLAGLCPGPALVSLASFEPKIFVFVVAMFLGQLAFLGLNKKMNINR